MKRQAFKSINPKLTKVAKIKVTFDMLDPMNVVYHGNYPKFLELARSNLLDEIGWGYREMNAAGIAFPVTDMNIRYSLPATLGDTLFIKAGILEWTPRLVVSYEIRTQSETGPLITRAQTTQVPVRVADKQTLWEAPKEMNEKFETYISNKL